MPSNAVAISSQQFAGPPAGALLFDANRFDRAGPELFDPACYGTHVEPVRASGGRGTAWFVAANGWEGVLRRYRRGGFIARFSRDAYLWQGSERTRAFREFRLLAAMRQHDLPVPAPLAAAYWRHGFIYRAAILVERLMQVRPLAHVLTELAWEATACAIVRMHRAGFWHADLNVFNVLLDTAGQAWLIDFDCGRDEGQLSEKQRNANLFRLRRSAEKVAGSVGIALWDRLYEVYQTLWQTKPSGERRS